MKKRYLLSAIWGGSTVAWGVACLFLSWQTGEGTGALSLAVARWLLRALAALGIRPEEARFHAGLRLLAHFGVFFIFGVLVCGTVESLKRFTRVSALGHLAAAISVTALALLTDVPKRWISGRHLTWSEAALNAVGALTGYLLMLGAIFLARRLSARKR